MKFSLRKVIEIFVLFSFLILLIFLGFFYSYLVRNEKKMEVEKSIYLLNSIAEGQLPYFTSELNEGNIKVLDFRTQIIQATYRDQSLEVFLFDSYYNSILDKKIENDILQNLKNNNVFVSENSIYLKKNITIGDDKLGFIIIKSLTNTQTSKFLQKSFSWSFISIFLIMILILLLLRLYLKSLILKPVTSLLDRVLLIDKFVNDNLQQSPFLKKSSSILEFNQLNESLLKLSQNLKNSINDKIRNEKEISENKVTIQISQQVAHDIRSPLTALNMILSQTNSMAMPEQSRILIRQSVNRINDIANSLLNQGKAKSKQNHINSTIGNSQSEMECVLLASLIDSVVSEKRVALRDNSRLQIEARLEKSYGLFAKINPIEMKRLLSNAINNSAEGIETPNQGLIEVILDSTKDKIILTIKDNGKGIPPHILAKLGTQGVTHGKEGTQSGSGLGVYHAKKTIESFGGHYEIQSTVGEGTSVILSLKKEEPPNWFVQKLLFEPEQYVVATDDDHSILEIWRQRFAHSNINLLTFTTSQSLKQWTLNNKEIAQNSIFLMDYELLGQTETGLDLIEELKLNQNENAILVSSRFEEPQVKERCSKLSVKMIPKGLASLVPFETKAPTAPKVKYDLCLIDDDRALIHTTWNFVAQSKGLNIKLFATPDEFLEDANNIDRSTPIYIDVSLGNGIKGTDFAKEVHQLGFKEINLATGYDADSIEVPHFISKTVGKDFPNI